MFYLLYFTYYHTITCHHPHITYDISLLHIILLLTADVP